MSIRDCTLLFLFLVCLMVGCSTKEFVQSDAHMPRDSAKARDHPLPRVWSIDDFIKRASSALAKALNGRESLKIAVTGIRTNNNEVNGLTDWLSDSLSTSLTGEYDGLIVERHRIDELISENIRAYNGLYDENNIIELGRLLSAQALVAGTVTECDNDYQINLRIIRALDGTVLSGCGYSGRICKNRDTIKKWSQKTSMIISITPQPLACEVYMDNKFIGFLSKSMTKFKLTTIVPGTHILRIIPVGAQPYELSFIQPKGRTISLKVNPGFKRDVERRKEFFAPGIAWMEEGESFRLVRGSYANCIHELDKLTYGFLTGACKWHIASVDEYLSWIENEALGLNPNTIYWTADKGCPGYAAKEFSIKKGVRCANKTEVYYMLFLCD